MTRLSFPTSMVLQSVRRNGRGGVARFSAVFGVFVALAACQHTPLTAPTGTAITLVANTNVLSVNGSTDITAILVQGSEVTTTTGGNGNQNSGTTAGTGVPVRDGTVVVFSTTLGRVEPAEAKTDGGKVTVRLIADGRSGTATVSAFSGPATKTLPVTIGAAAASRILVAASPQALPFTGGTSTITATVQDQQGNGLLGVPVTFSTSAGSLGSGSGVTDASGNAFTTLSTTAAATVTASSGGASGTLSGTVAITIKPRTTVTLTTPTAITASVPALFTVGVGTNTIVTDVVVDFGDGEKQPLGSISASQNVSHVYGDSGSYQVTVTATDSEGNRTPIQTAVVVAPLSAVGTANPTIAVLGNSVLFTVTVSTGALIDHYDWDFGEVGFPDSKITGSKSNSINHVYRIKGTKVITVIVYPTKGPPITVLISCEIT
jgi:PKD repeat protein